MMYVKVDPYHSQADLAEDRSSCREKVKSKKMVKISLSIRKKTFTLTTFGSLLHILTIMSPRS